MLCTTSLTRTQPPSPHASERVPVGSVTASVPRLRIPRATESSLTNANYFQIWDKTRGDTARRMGNVLPWAGGLQPQREPPALPAPARSRRCTRQPSSLRDLFSAVGLSVKVISTQAGGSKQKNKKGMRFFMEEGCFIACIIQSKFT